MKAEYSNEQYCQIEERARMLAQEKSYLQLIIKMMNRLGELPGLENTVNTLIQLILESIGGSNAMIYYMIDNELHSNDIGFKDIIIDHPDDDYVISVFDTKQFIEVIGDFENTKLLTNNFTKAYTWICPLLAGNELIGVIKIENLHIASIDFKNELPTFFNYAAIVLKNEILGYTKLKKAYDQINESEKQLQSLFNNMNEGVALHELVFEGEKPVNYRIVDVNDQFEKIIGLSREQVDGKLCTEVYGTATPPYFAEYIAVATSKTPIYFESYFADMDKHFAISAAPWQENGFATIFTDITERKQEQLDLGLKNEQLLKLNSEKDKFFSIIAHDLRGPFNGFLGLSQIMAEELPNLAMAEAQGLAISMKNSAANLYNLLENLLKWSQFQKGVIPFSPEVIRLQPMIDECIAIASESAKNKGISISSSIPGDTKVFADSNMLQTIIRNLVSNALKFTPKGGKINVSAKTTSEYCVEIAIQDTGIGMSQEMVENLFRIDVITNRKSTEGEPSSGLGLLLCKEFVEKHGGQIWVESKEGVGSKFHFTIPYHTGSNEEITEAKGLPGEAKKEPGIFLKVLIVDDDDISRSYLAFISKGFSKKILFAENGKEAVELVRNTRGIHLILMDMKMPVMN